MGAFYKIQVIICLQILPTLLLGVPLNDIKKSIPLDGRIVGGVETTIQQFPHQVSLQLNGNHFCGANVIHSQVLLTAAHCVSNQKAEALQVRAGSAEIRNGGVLFKVRTIILNKDYNLPTNLNNDIALLILDMPLTFSQKIRAIPLNTARDVLQPRQSLFVSGWGTTSPNNPQVSPRLRYAVVEEIDHGKCIAAYRTTAKVTSSMICAGVEKGGRDSCQGDSGGPLVGYIKGTLKLIGVVSWGVSCANAAYPGVYTRVSDHEVWIRDQMKQNGGFEL